MNQWYYSDTQRQQQGPISTDELTILHQQGAVTPETLVWRDGMSDWRPWREVMAEIIASNTGNDTVIDMVVEPAAGMGVVPTTETGSATLQVATEAAPDHVNDRIDDSFESSPYSPPKAAVTHSHNAHLDAGRVVYAGFLKRFAGLFIDNTITMVLSYAVIIPMYMMAGLGVFGMKSTTENPFESGMFIGVLLGTYAVAFTLPSLYYGWMQASSKQATLGKMAAGIKIVRSDGSRIGFWRGFLRHLAQILFAMFSCGLGSLISAIMTAVTERKQALHDMICDTVVVDKYAFTASKDLQKEELTTATIIILVIEVLLMLGAIAAYAVFIAMVVNGKTPSWA